jgi:hypothetical protein
MDAINLLDYEHMSPTRSEGHVPASLQAVAGIGYVLGRVTRIHAHTR